MIRKDYSEHLKKLIDMQETIKGIHPVFTEYYPVTIVEDGYFHIYDISADGQKYQYVKSEPCPIPNPEGLRAAFPLDFYNNKISSVLTGEVFDTIQGYITILHEFVHCAQYQECENELKSQLGIAQEYQKNKNYMWELNHPFPYNKQDFIRNYSLYMEALTTSNYQVATNLRTRFKDFLDKEDREYLLWQEWKEGFARFLENKVYIYFGLPENHYGSEIPYNRVSFYESGSGFLSLLEQTNANTILDMKGMFVEMKKGLMEYGY